MTDDDHHSLDALARLHLVMEQAAALQRTLTSLPPGAAWWITTGEVGAVARLVEKLRWASTAGLRQKGLQTHAQRVVDRARELTAREPVALTTVRIFEPRSDGVLDAVTQLEALLGTTAREEKFISPSGKDADAAYRISGPGGIDFLVFASEKNGAGLDFVVEDLVAVRQRLEAAGAFALGADGDGPAVMPCGGVVMAATQQGWLDEQQAIVEQLASERR